MRGVPMMRVEVAGTAVTPSGVLDLLQRDSTGTSQKTVTGDARIDALL
jgi:hypothetical protein